MAFAELKAPKQKPRKIQKMFHNKLRALGFAVYVVDDKKLIGGVLDEIQSSRISKTAIEFIKNNPVC